MLLTRMKQEIFLVQRQQNIFNITKLENVNKILDECEIFQVINLQNVNETILDEFDSCENLSEGVSKSAEEKIKKASTLVKIYQNQIKTVT